MNRREAMTTLGAGAASLGLPRPGAEAQRGTDAEHRRPNLIFILADDLGYGDLGCYGQKVLQTPNLDRMAAEGVRFTDCYAGSTVCAPSRCCLMTGLHTGHAHVRGNALVPLRPQDTTVAEVLADAGYRTALVGKWGLGEPGSTGIPRRKGFHEFYGYLNQVHAHNSFPEYLWRNEQQERLPGNEHGQMRTFANDRFADEAGAFIQRNCQRPFFLYYAPVIPHANNERGRDTGMGIDSPDEGIYADRPWPEVERKFAATVTRLDGYIGRLLAQLRALGLERDTIVLFTSDNGPHQEGGHQADFFHSRGPLTGIKRSLTEGGIRVPMLAWGPGRVAAGQVNGTPWALWDWLPTAAALAGATTPAGLDGVSVAPLLGGGTLAGERAFYWEFHEGGFRQAVRRGRWKAIRQGLSGPVRLHDLETDLSERTDLAATRPDVAKAMAGLLDSARTDSVEFPVRAR